MPHPGYVSRDTLRRIFATPITKDVGDSIFNRQRKKKTRRATRVSIFSGAYLPSRAAFSPRNMLIIRAPVTFLYRDTLRLAPERQGRRIFIISPQLRCIIYVRQFDFRGFQSHRARSTSATRRALLFSYNVGRSDERRIYARRRMIRHAPSFSRHRSSRKPSIFQRFDCVPLARTFPDSWISQIP